MMDSGQSDAPGIIRPGEGERLAQVRVENLDILLARAFGEQHAVDLEVDDAEFLIELLKAREEAVR